MNPDVMSSLIDLGAAGAVIGVVILFLKFIEKRDKEWQGFFTLIRKQDEERQSKLIQAVQKLIDEFKEHDTWEHTKLDEMSDKIKPARRQAASK